jgi:hypothetical protein
LPVSRFIQGRPVFRTAFFCGRKEPAPVARHHEAMGYNLLSLLVLILWIVAIVDCAKSSNPNKVVWIIVIILVPLLGSILYFLFGKSR